MVAVVGVIEDEFAIFDAEGPFFTHASVSLL